MSPRVANRCLHPACWGHEQLKNFAHASEYTKFADNLWWLCARQLVGRMVRKQEQLAYVQYPDVPPGLQPHRPELAQPRAYHGFFFGGRQESVVEAQAGARLAPLLSNPLAPPTVPMIAELCGAPMDMAGEWAEGIPVPRPLRARLDEYWLHTSLAVSGGGLLSSTPSLGEQVVRLLSSDLQALAGRTHRATPEVPVGVQAGVRHTAGVLAVHATVGSASVDCGVSVALVDALVRASCRQGHERCTLPGLWGGRVLVTEAVAVGVPVNESRAPSWRSASMQACTKELGAAGVAHLVHTPPHTAGVRHASHVVAGREVDVVVLDASRLPMPRARGAARLQVSTSAAWLGDRGFNEGWGCGGGEDSGAPMALKAATLGAEVSQWWDKVAVNGSMYVVLPAGTTRDSLADGTRACVPVSGVAGVEVAVGAVAGSGGNADAGSRWMAHSHGPGVRMRRMLVSAGGRVSRGDATGKAWWVLRATRER